MLNCSLPCHSFILETQTTLTKKSCSKKLTSNWSIHCFDFANNLSRSRSLPSYYTLHSSFDGIVASNLAKFTHILKCFGNLIAFHIVVTFNHANFWNFKLNICLYTKQKEPYKLNNKQFIVTYIEFQSTQAYALICNNQHRYNDERNPPSKATQAHQEQVVWWKVQE
jgi:hypothetical protein